MVNPSHMQQVGHLASSNGKACDVIRQAGKWSEFHSILRANFLLVLYENSALPIPEDSDTVLVMILMFLVT